MKRKYPFCVGPHGDEAKVRDAILGLHRMAAYGRIAERALRALERDGEFDKRTPIVTSSAIIYDAQIEIVRFPRFVAVSRADVPEYGPLDFSFGKPTQGWHGGTDTEEIRIHLRCVGWDWTNEWMKRNIHIGNARFKKNGAVVFVEQRDGHPKGVYKLSGSHDQLVLLGDSIARNIVNFSAYDLKENRISQAIQDIRCTLGTWLVEDGHIQEFCRKVRKEAMAATVMHS